MIKHFLIGTDPECIIFNKETKQPVSAIDLIPGSKWIPEIISEQGHAIQVDNVLAEFNIPPTNSKEEFLSHINFVKDYLNTFVKEKNPNLEILCDSGIDFPEEELDNPMAHQIGCDPDFNAWLHGKKNSKPRSFQTGYRSCGFHIHIGYSGPSKKTNIQLAKLMDLFIGVPSVLYDTDERRRKLYGNAGSFRNCAHGVEWRTLSGKFLKNDNTINWVWDRVMDVIDAYNSEFDVDKYKDDIIESINNNNIQLAEKLVKQLNIKILEE